jgi:hypothetical protein
MGHESEPLDLDLEEDDDLDLPNLFDETRNRGVSPNSA